MRLTVSTLALGTLLALCASTAFTQSGPPYTGYNNSPYTTGYYSGGIWLEKVVIKQGSTTLLTNQSGANPTAPYNTFFGAITPANLIPGAVHTIECTVGQYSTTTAYQSCTAWIDYDNDGVFSDATERIGYHNKVVGNGTGVISFIPPTGIGGVRRLRIREVYSTNPPHGAYTSYSYGEAEDYLVNLGFAISTQSPLPTAAVSTSYSTTISAVNGAAPYTWQFSANGYVDPNGTAPQGTTYGLPPGITATVNNNNLVLASTSSTSITTIGVYYFEVEVHDNAAKVSSKGFQITVVPQPAALPFTDDFSSFKGWVTDPTWTRGPATAYSGSNPTRSEPGSDHTPSPNNDNMVLGDNIGGDYAVSQSTIRWAVSPMVNCTGAANIRLRFWRWAGFAIGTEAWIQVSNNGNNWNTVWHFDGTGGTISDGTGSNPGWKSVFYNITQWAAGQATVQVRFGIGPTGTNPHTGWLIDDVIIEEPGPDLTVKEGGAGGTPITDSQAVGGLRDFGQVAVSAQSTPLTIYFENTGPSTITFGTMSKTGLQPTDFYVNASAMINPLPPGQATSFTVTFYRTTVGVSTATLNWPHNASGSGTSPFEIHLRGEAVILQPDLEVRLGAANGPLIPHNDLNYGPRDFGNQMVNTTSAPITLFIVNAGNGPVNISTPDMGGAWWNQYTLNTSSIVSQLAAGASTSFEVAFHPTSAGSKDALVRISHTDGAKPSPYLVPVIGNGVTSSQAGLTVHDGDITAPTINHNAAATGQRNFGNQLVAAGPTPPITITIENSGGTNLTPGTPTLGGNDPGEFVLNTGAFLNTVAAGANTSFTIAFDPSSTGTKTATVSFTHNDSSVTSPFVINVVGNGVNTAPVMEVRETNQGGALLTNPAAATGILDFGTIDVNAGPAATATIYVENVGSANLTLGNVSFQNPTTEFSLQAVGFAQTLPVGQSATFNIIFDPTTPGTHTAVVQFTHNDGAAGSPFRLNVTGDATQNAPVIEVREGTTIGQMVTSGAPVIAGGLRDCGSVDVSGGNTFPAVIVVMNTGNQNLTLGTPTISGVNASDFVLNTANWNTTLTPGSNCSLDVMFDPVLGGMKDCHVEFTQNDPGKPTPFVVRFRGTGVDPNGVQITTPDLQGATAGQDYGPFQLEAIQGNTPYAWSIYDGTLPLGLTLSNAGVIDGKPAGFGASNQVTIRVADSTGATHERQYTIVVTGDRTGGSAKDSGCAVNNSGSGANLGLAILGLLAVAGCAIGLRRRTE